MAKRAYNPTRFASMVISQSRLIGTKGSNGLPPVSKVTKDGDLEKFAIEETQGWTIKPGRKRARGAYCVPHRAHLRPELCSQELRLDPVYMLPIEAVVFEWPDPVTSASTSAATTPSNTPNKKPKIELLTDFQLRDGHFVAASRCTYGARDLVN
jgi:hypothetical protein